jgi:hypothetical protein
VGGAPAHFQQQSFLWMKVILKQRLSQAKWHDRTDRQSLTGAEWDFQQQYRKFDFLSTIQLRSDALTIATVLFARLKPVASCGV